MLFALLCTLGLNTLDMSRWHHPVGYAKAPLYADGRLILWDAGEGRIKVYAFADWSVRPELVWASKGEGEGPGEIPKGATIHNFALDAVTGRLWLSHRYGYSVFDRQGRFITRHKIPFNESKIVVIDDILFMTPVNRMRMPWLMVSSPIQTQEKPTWRVDSLHHPPINAAGDYIDPGIEIAMGPERFFRYDANIGELTAVGREGRIEWHVRLPIVVPPAARVEDFQEFTYGQRFAMIRIESSTSGLLVDKNAVTLLEKQFVPELVTERRKIENSRDQDTGELEAFRVLTRVDAKTGEIMGRFAYPIMQKAVSLLAMRDSKILFFDMDEGNRLHLVDEKELERLPQ